MTRRGGAKAEAAPRRDHGERHCVSYRVALCATACAVLFTLAAPAWAHTGLVSSTPSPDESVDGPLSELTLAFNQPVELAGAGVEVLDETGAAVAVAATVADEVVSVRPRQPLDGGPYGVRWAVRSGDAHPVRGTFVFTVVAPAVVAPEFVAPVSADRATVQRGGGAQERPAVAVSRRSVTLDAALAADPLAGIRRLDQALRAVFYSAALGAVGMLVFLVGVWDGTRREARRLTRLCARLAGVAGLVVLAQVLVRSARTTGGWSAALSGIPSTLTGTYATGTVMRLVGAALLVAGMGTLRRSLRAAVAPIAGAAIDVHPPPVGMPPAPSSSAGRRLRSTPSAILGALLLVGSFAFVGHAATAAPRSISLTAVIAHVSAAAMWGGGLLALVVTLTARRRAGRPLQAGLIATRFSVVATVGVALAGAAGVALAAVRLADVAALWSTPYGLVLVAKVAVVGVVGGIGAYNHFVTVPLLRADPDHPIGDRLRRLGLIEVVLVLLVAALTSVLVGLAG